MLRGMPAFPTTWYFDNRVMPRRPYLQEDWITLVLANPLEREVESNGRIRHWGEIAETSWKYLRVITEPDGLTVHNAFPDRTFRARLQRKG